MREVSTSSTRPSGWWRSLPTTVAGAVLVIARRCSPDQRPAGLPLHELPAALRALELAVVHDDLAAREDHGRAAFDLPPLVGVVVHLHVVGLGRERRLL